MVEFTLAVYIGRFSPLHQGHFSMMLRALDRYDHMLVIVGSAEQPRTIKNPWTADERSRMIWSTLTEHLGAESATASVTVKHSRDYPYNDQLWLSQISTLIDDKVRQVRNSFSLRGQPPSVKVIIIGSDRDESTYYLNCFPQYEKGLTDKDKITHSPSLSATLVRDLYFGNVFNGAVNEEATVNMLLVSVMPRPALDVMTSFKSTPEYATLKAEYEHIKGYKEAWAAAPYAPTFVTVDAAVIQSGHVLVVRRRSAPGKGLYALPGGFLNQNERCLDGAIRELREETRLKVPPAVLRGSVVRKEIFDKPDRSLRGRTVTIAYHLSLPETGELPPVKGGDDALAAEWLPLSRLSKLQHEFFEDHFHIIEQFVGGQL